MTVVARCRSVSAAAAMSQKLAKTPSTGSATSAPQTSARATADPKFSPRDQPELSNSFEIRDLEASTAIPLYLVGPKDANENYMHLT
jgi:hypothetical protein